VVVAASVAGGSDVFVVEDRLCEETWRFAHPQIAKIPTAAMRLIVRIVCCRIISHHASYTERKALGDAPPLASSAIEMRPAHSLP